MSVFEELPKSAHRCECDLCNVVRLFSEISRETPYYRDRLDWVFNMLGESMDDAAIWKGHYEGTWFGQTVEHENEMHQRRVERIRERMSAEF